MTVHYPEGVQAQGNIKVQAVEALTTPGAVSLATDINDATSLDVTMFLYPNGWGPSVTSNKGTKPPRLGSKELLESFNRPTRQLPDLIYAYDPQAADSDPDNQALVFFEPGKEMFFIERRGLDANDEDWAVGQYVKIHHVRLGERYDIADPTDENAEFQMQQALIYLTPPSERLAIAA